jgi:hypothetical protein
MEPPNAINAINHRVHVSLLYIHHDRRLLDRW